jgi:hypothetical protein
MQGETILFELLMAGFFAVACIRAHGPIDPHKKLGLAEFLRLSDRLERMKQTRWQWFSMVALMLVIRLQQPIPLVLEVMVAAQFGLFLALPVRSQRKAGVRRR